MLRNLTTAGLASIVLAALVLILAAVARPRDQRSAAGPQSARRADSSSGQETPAPQAGRPFPSPETGLSLFREQVRPLLTEKCLTCHGSGRREGGLDLSRRSAALTGGVSGPAIVPGRPVESLAYQLVTAAEMPPDMKFLSSAEIAALKRWIELGAPYEGEPLTSGQGAITRDAQGPDAIASGQTRASGTGVSALSTPLSQSQARERAEHYLKSIGNPNLKIGNVNQSILAYEVQVVTRDGSLVNWIIVDKRTSRMKFLY